MRLASLFLVVLAVSFSSCKPTCPAGELECLVKTLQVSDITADVSGEGTRLELSPVDTVRLGNVQELSNADGGSNANGGLSLEANTRLDFETSIDFGVIFFTFQDPLACRPALCFTPCPKNARCLGGSSCTPAVGDGLRSGTGFHRVEYGSQPATELDFEILVTPVSAPGCPASVAQALVDGTARVGLSSVVEVHIPGADGTGVPSGTGGGSGAGGGAGSGGGGGSGTCPGGFVGSTRLNIPNGTGGCTATTGAAGQCLTSADFTAAGVPYPGACAPSGTTACFSNGTVVRPCCGTLRCVVGSACGGDSTVGGKCM